MSESPSSPFHLSNTHTSYHHQDHYSHFTSYPSLLLFSRYEQYQDTMVSKDPKCPCVRLFKCLGLCKKRAQEEHELITIAARDVPIIPPTRTQTIVPESSAGTKTRKLSVALPSKRTKQELSNDTCNNWFENLVNTDQSSGNSGEPSTMDASNQPEEALTKDASDQEEASNKNTSDQSPQAI